MKLVNIIVCTFNRHNQLKQALESVEIQTYKYLKVFVVADGHDPAVEEIVQEFNSKSDITYIYIHTPVHYGAWGAMTKKLGLMQIEEDDSYVFWLDDDNVLYSNYVEDLVEAFNEDCGIVYGNVEFDSHYCKTLPNSDLHNKFEECKIDQLCYMVKSSIAKKCGDFFLPCFANDLHFIDACSHHTNSVYVNKKIGCHKFSPRPFPNEWLTMDNVRFYQELIAATVPYQGNIAEIGYWQNGIIHNMCEIIKTKDIRVNLIDIHDYNLSNPIETIIDFSDNYFNLIFIDIDVDNNLKNMLLTWVPKLKSKGLICGYDRENVNLVVKEIFGNTYNVKKNIWYAINNYK
jgi:glycosyltransferase involved in cell wall biosynthesis